MIVCNTNLYKKMISSCQILFRISKARPIPVVPTPEIKEETREEIPEPRDAILCRVCRRIITYPEEQIEVSGAHQHTFANPHGIVFEIGCFKSAKGCAHFGLSTPEFSWFKGFQWKLSACLFCMTHLGWFYTGPEGTSFYGLILDRLIFPP
ncbi:MAG: cereblon family protein [Thermodesulfobacteriota bacterium]